MKAWRCFSPWAIERFMNTGLRGADEQPTQKVLDGGFSGKPGTSSATFSSLDSTRRKQLG